jgi:anhydro-N-acetylmuramic acid kinase
MRVIGLISGTSYDAIEAAAVDLDLAEGVIACDLLGSLSVPYPDELAARIAAALPPASTTLEEVCRLDTAIGQAFAGCAAEANAALCDDAAQLVCSHGQTMFHWVEDGVARGTLQLGQPAWIAERTGLPVVSDVRPADIAAGGHGAPLVSLLDELLMRPGPGEPPRAALNLGGIANLTIVADGAPSVAFDVGPANALIDAAVTHVSGGADRFDRDGERAARGRVADEALARLLDEPYYALAPPKSTGKELLHLPYLLDRLAGLELAPDDVVATVTQLTVETVARDVRRYGVAEVVAAGGGTLNPTLMARLEHALGPGARLTTTATLGIPPTAKEAVAFALIGFLTAQGIPANVPSATGARRRVVLGRVTPGDRPPAGGGPAREALRSLVVRTPHPSLRPAARR